MAECFQSLHEYAPDSIAIGATLYYYSVALTMIESNSNPVDIIRMKRSVSTLTECLQTPWIAISDRNRALCYFTRGKAFQRLGQYEQSIEDFNVVISFEKENTLPYALFRRAWCYKVTI